MINRRYLSSLAIVLLVGCLCALAGAEVKSGPAKLAESKFGPPDGAPAVVMGKAIKLTGKFYISDFFGSKVIQAEATVKNTARVPMFYSFHVAFFDKDNHLLGCVSQSSVGDNGLKPGEETQLGSLLVTLPAPELPKVATFQAAFYESQHKF